MPFTTNKWIVARRRDGAVVRFGNVGLLVFGDEGETLAREVANKLNTHELLVDAIDAALRDEDRGYTLRGETADALREAIRLGRGGG